MWSGDTCLWLFGPEGLRQRRRFRLDDMPRRPTLPQVCSGLFAGPQSGGLRNERCLVRLCRRYSAAHRLANLLFATRSIVSVSFRSDARLDGLKPTKDTASRWPPCEVYCDHPHPRKTLNPKGSFAFQVFAGVGAPYGRERVVAEKAET